MTDITSQQFLELNQKIDQLQKMVQSIQTSVDSLNQITEIQNTLPKTIESIVKATFNKYLVLPEDYDASIQAMVDQKNKNSSTKSSSYYQDTERKSQDVKRNPSSSLTQNNVKEEPKKIIPILPKEKKSAITEICEIPDKQTTFGVKGEVIVAYDRKDGVVELNESKNILANIPNEIVNDIGFTKNGTLLIGTDNGIITSKDEEVNKIDISAKSCCEFMDQIVSVCPHGLTYKDGEERKTLKQINSKIEFKDPIKVRASHEYLFVNDSETKILSIFNSSFKIIKAINSSKFIDFCIISDSQIGVIFDKSIRIINIADKSLFVEKEIKLEKEGTKISLARIECVDNQTDPYLVALGNDCKTLYKIPLAFFKSSLKKSK
ncbi:hypothetical protein EDI_351070 [Entamoeba dispar SAW760]|uniref:Uncharacterized protein n=1 Tax=Entamoeba dispar (strain ATCC PRA-260 / SAW760) TaxID=370354 RepID=B0ELK7_ENTDS|nr:uncharacterized protein EDI_351070 [Entamoeba dispar SAW760]EDR24591.1 hypothetical protein EDI_351070 [Entamoeba dispar SAW760]|eukprot:EDR24591.1 hypothetical protein EDI_351070 [Entamoeba dispar SAW760]